MGETILNLCRSLEALFPPTKGLQSRDAVRAGLAQLGYTSDGVERDFMPVMALRSTIDSGHVHLSIFTSAQLAVVHGYTERLEGIFQRLLNRVIDSLERGGLALAPYDDPSPSSEALQVIEKIAARAAADSPLQEAIPTREASSPKRNLP